MNNWKCPDTFGSKMLEGSGDAAEERGALLLGGHRFHCRGVDASHDCFCRLGERDAGVGLGWGVEEEPGEEGGVERNKGERESSSPGLCLRKRGGEFFFPKARGLLLASFPRQSSFSYCFDSARTRGRKGKGSSKRAGDGSECEHFAFAWSSYIGASSRMRPFSFFRATYSRSFCLETIRDITS